MLQPFCDGSFLIEHKPTPQLQFWSKSGTARGSSNHCFVQWGKANSQTFEQKARNSKYNTNTLQALHPAAPTSCRQSWHSLASTLQVLMWLLSLFRCFFISQTFLGRATRANVLVNVGQTDISVV